MLSRVTERKSPNTMSKSKSNSNKLDSLDIYKVAFPFSVYLAQIVAKFDRRYKFIVGDEIIKVSISMRKCIVRANRANDKKKAAGFVLECLEQVDMLEDLTSFAVELGIMSIEQKAICDESIVQLWENGRRWRKYFLRVSGQSTDSDTESVESHE